MTQEGESLLRRLERPVDVASGEILEAAPELAVILPAQDVGYRQE